MQNTHQSVFGRALTTELPPARRSLQLTQREVGEYSLLQALDAFTSLRSTRRFELETSEALAESYGIPPPERSGRLFIPAQIFRTAAARALTQHPGGSGGYLTPTDTGPFIDIIRPLTVPGRLNAQTLPNLQGDVVFPVESAGMSAQWQSGDGSATTHTDPALGSISLAPRVAVAAVTLSRTLIKLSPQAAEQAARTMVVGALRDALSRAALAGTGGSQPLGLMNAAPVASFNGAALNHAGFLAEVEGLLAAGADDVAVVAAPDVALALAKRQAFDASRPMWEGSLGEGNVLGHRAIGTAHLAAGTMLIGDFRELLLASWAGDVEILVDPYTGFNSGSVTFRAAMTCDVAAMRPAAFRKTASFS